MAGRRNSGERRERIVRGLRLVMARAGYDGATVTQIAEAAGLAPGLVHYHFRDKEEILVELVRELGRDARERAIRAGHAAAGDDPRARVRGILRAWTSRDSADAEAVACWVVAASESVRRPRVREALADELRALAELIHAALPARRHVARDAAAAGIVAAVLGYLVLAAVAPAVIPSGSAADTLDAMLDGLTAQARSARSRRGSR